MHLQPHDNHGFREVLRFALVLAICLTGTSAAEAAVGKKDLQVISAWLTEPPAERAKVSELDGLERELNRKAAQRAAAKLWQAYCSAMQKEKPAHLVPTASNVPLPQGIEGLDVYETVVDKKTMPFVIVEKDNSTNEPRPLFICLHGGGSAGGNAPSPHGWPVNTREWAAQIQLAQRVYQPNGVYIVPRMPDDNDGRWWFNYCQESYVRLIRAGLALKNIDPNRVYLLGISEGGYGSLRLGANMPDYWAAVGPMAAGEPIANAPPENLRNVAFRTEIGQRDKTLDRVGLAKKFHTELSRLQSEDNQGYKHHLNVQAGRGHGVDYSQCPTWLAQHSRNPWPRRIVWNRIAMHAIVRQQVYWLGCKTEKDSEPLLLAAELQPEENLVNLTMKSAQDGGENSSTPAEITIWLNDEMLDLDRPVRVLCNGAQVFEGTVKRQLKNLVRSLDRRGDPQLMFPAALTFSLSKPD